MELRHLRYFVAVAEELNFSRAAERLHMAQPPLSHQIHSLEAELKVQLFDRTKRPLQITSAGKAFLEEARSTLAQVEQAVRMTRRIHQGELGYLTISFTSSMANSILPDILRAFRERYPSVELILREENSASLIQGLRDRYTDITFIYKYRALPEVDNWGIITLDEQPLVVVLPENHPLATHSKILFSDLADEFFVIPLQQVVYGLSAQIYHLCSQAGFVPKIAQEAIFMVTILGLVAGGIGISILPSSVQSLQRKGVVYRPIQEQVSTLQLAAVWQQDNSSATLHNFLELLREQYPLS
jgi:DNA-binding transcriptional LysR family regulator